MLVSSRLAQNSAVNSLVSIWSDRYLPDLSQLPLSSDITVRAQLRQASSQVGRAALVARLSGSALQEKCRLAAIQSHNYYSSVSGEGTYKEIMNTSRQTHKIYAKLLGLYQQDFRQASKDELQEAFGDSSLAAWGIPKIGKLADELEPLLLEFQESQRICKDWRSLGFLTTQINFANALVAAELSPVEQFLLSPYLNFVEEQVALPWQRVCAAAVRHEVNAPEVALVRHLMQATSNIAATSHRRFQKAFPLHYTCTGSLDDPRVKHSSLRDYSMFQAYLYLCVLQNSLKPIEQELIALCLMVFEKIGIPWQMTVKGTELLIEEIEKRLDPQQQALLRPYAHGMVMAFKQA